MTLDASILLWIQENIRCSFLSAILIPYTHSSDIGLFWFAIIALLIVFPKTRKAGIIPLVSLVVTFVINDGILKNIINRTRPFDVVPGLVALVKRPHGSSCPSGHSAIAFASAVAIFLNSKKSIGIPMLILAVIMAFSRLYVGVHYPTDILIGASVGFTVAIFVSYFMNNFIFKRFQRKNQKSN